MAGKEAKQATAKSTVKIKLVRSINGTRESHRATVRGLSLRKLGSEVEFLTPRLHLPVRLARPRRRT